MRNILEKTMTGEYIRVSTQEQAVEGYSIGEQEARLGKYCEAHGWTVYKVYSDPGFSGGSMDRPGLKQMIADVAAGKLDKVVVYKLDRLSRSQKDTLYLIEDVFLENGVDFVSMTENFDTATPFGKAMIGILSVFAQLEREQIKERMSIGREGRAKSGLWRGGGNVPIGYRYNDGVLKVDKYETEIVKRIYDEYLSGKTITSISSGLVRENRRSSYGVFTRTTVRQILLRPVYAGLIEHNGTLYDGSHEPIISRETWEEAHKRLEESAATDVQHLCFSRRVSIVTGLCYCGECGRKMVSRYNKRQDQSYRKTIACPGKKKSGCHTKPYIRSDVETAVITEIGKLRLDPEYLREVRSQTETSDTEKRIRVAEERIAYNNARISKYMDLYTIGGIDIMSIKEKIEALTSENDTLTAEVEKLRREQGENMTDDEIGDKADALNEYLSEDDVERARGIVTELIERIELRGDEIKIFWSF